MSYGNNDEDEHGEQVYGRIPTVSRKVSKQAHRRFEQVERVGPEERRCLLICPPFGSLSREERPLRIKYKLDPTPEKGDLVFALSIFIN